MLTAPTFIESTSEAAQAHSLSAAFNPIDLRHDGRETTSNDVMPFTADKLLSSGSSVEKAFILGPGRAPIPAKLVTQITLHKFIELSELIPENLEDPQVDSTLQPFLSRALPLSRKLFRARNRRFPTF